MEYKDAYHIAIPSLQDIKELTGRDLVVEGGYTKEVTEARVLSYTLKAKDFLMRDKSQRFMNAFSYLVKFNDKWTYAWKIYAIRYIEATMLYGDETTWQKVPFEVQNSIDGSVLRAYHFTTSLYDEVEQSEESW